MSRTLLCLGALLSVTFAAYGGVVRTRDGLALQANLPQRLAAVKIDGQAVSTGAGGLTLTDPRTGQPPPAGKFTLTSNIQAQAGQIIVSGTLTAAGTAETVCLLRAYIPVGGAGWLYWDDMSRSRPIQSGQTYNQTVYPLACVTSPDLKLGLAVAMAPDPEQPAVLSYDPARKCLVVSWHLGFTPLARPEYRMKAPFKIEIYRLQPGWAFRSALDRYYRFHPEQFDRRAPYNGLWLFASSAASLPNPQHYAYHEGGPPLSADLARGIHTFPYTCTGNLTIALPVAWGTPKTYQGMLDRLHRWAQRPHLVGWERLTDYELDPEQPHSGKLSLKLQVTKAGQTEEIRQAIPLGQKRVDPVTASVWTRAKDVTGHQDSNYGLFLDLVMADGTNQFGQVAPARVGTHGWQQVKITVGKDKPISQINLYLLLRGQHTGTAWFDDVSVSTASAPDQNLVHSPGFESVGPPPEMKLLHDNVMYDRNDHMRYHADTWGGADIAPASPINWLRFILLVNPDEKNADGEPTAAQKDLTLCDGIFHHYPQCAGIYMDGTSACTTTTYEYRRDHFSCFSDPFMYRQGIYRPCANGMASVVRYVDAFKQRYQGRKLAFGNVWASKRMFYMCMALDVPGFESSRWYDLTYADYYRAAAARKPGLYLNYFRLGQQIDTREGGERFFRYATAYGLFPSIGRFTTEAYQKFGDLQHLYIPIVKHLSRAGWQPITYARVNDPQVRLERFGAKLPLYFTLLNPTAVPRQVKLQVDAAALGLKATPAALEMTTSASLPLTRHGATLETKVVLGPQDVAVVVLLPNGGVGAWYRDRAAEILQGASYIYAQTPPTVETATLATHVREIPAGADKRAIARAVGNVIIDLHRLQSQAGSLPDDLKRVSYRRELDEGERLLTESLLADTGSQVGWSGRLIAPVDGQITAAPAIWRGPGAKVTVMQPRYIFQRLVETAGAELQSAGVQPDGALSLKLPDMNHTSVTLVSQVDFLDAAGRPARLQRRGYAYFGPISELKADYSAGQRVITVHVQNLDTKPRSFQMRLTAPAGIDLKPAQVAMTLPAGAERTVPVQVSFSSKLASGSYPIAVSLALAGGKMIDRAAVKVQYVLPLAPGDLALAATGAQVAVDSAYYAYSAAPLNDGVVQPVGVAFNQAAWAAAETPTSHWVEINWPHPEHVGRVVVYWNIEDQKTWTSREIQVQVKEGGRWRTVADVHPHQGEPVSTVSFPPASTGALRVVQPKGEGPASRLNIMWLREVAVYAH